MVELDQLLNLAISKQASDLHIGVGSEPALRIKGDLKKVDSLPMTQESMKKLVYSILDDEQQRKLEAQKRLTLSFQYNDLARFRMNLFQQAGLTANLRRLPVELPKLNSINLPPSAKDLVYCPSGLILVASPKAMGKTTTIATLLEKMNAELNRHIFTIECPVEFQMKSQQCLITQREVDIASTDFHRLAAEVIAMDADVVVLPELQSRELVEVAIKLTQAGLLVIAPSTVSTSVQALLGFLDHFPNDDRQRISFHLSQSLQGVISQRLIPRQEDGVALACEILIATPAIREALSAMQFNDLEDRMKRDDEKSGMMTLNQSIVTLLLRREISLKSAFAHSSDPEELDVLLKKAGI